jgi:methyl coenzyme M reductase alpha subunit
MKEFWKRHGNKFKVAGTIALGVVTLGGAVALALPAIFANDLGDTDVSFLPDDLQTLLNAADKEMQDDIALLITDLKEDGTADSLILDCIRHMLSDEPPVS